MSSTIEVTSHATDVHAAAARLRTSVAAVDARDADLRDALHLVGRALDELSAMSETLCREYTVAGPVSSDLLRRSHELTSSLCAARWNAELVRRHLPKHPGPSAYGSTSPRRIA